MNKKKVCFAASSGGHFEQLTMLKPLMDKYNSFVVTEKTTYNVIFFILLLISKLFALILIPSSCLYNALYNFRLFA